MPMSSDFDMPVQLEKWFILNPNGYVGPYSSKDIAELILQKKIGGLNRIWSESISNWQALKDINEFKLQFEFHPTLKDQVFTVFDPAPRPQWIEDTQQDELATLSTPEVLADTFQADSLKIKNNNYFTVYVAIGLIIGLGGYLTLKETLRDRSTFSGFAELNETQNNFLKHTTEQLNTTPQASFVFLKNSFYIASSLPKNAILDLSFSPLQHTFFQSPKPLAPQVLKIQNRSSHGHYPLSLDGEPLAPGFYTTRLSFEGTVLYEKNLYFGEMKYDEYLTKLHDFNQEKIISAQAEVTELNQIIYSLDQQANTLYGHFLNVQNLAKKTNAKTQIMDKWKKDTEEWLSFQSQIEVMIQSRHLDPNNGYFYQELFLKIETVEKKISDLKNTLNILVIDSNFENVTSIEKEFFDTQSEISRLKSKIDYLQSKLKI